MRKRKKYYLKKKKKKEKEKERKWTLFLNDITVATITALFIERLVRSVLNAEKLSYLLSQLKS